MTDALRVHDLVVGKTGDLQVRQFVQLGTPKPVAVSLEPEQVGEVIECGHVRQMVLRNIHVTQMDVGAQQLDVRQFSRRWKEEAMVQGENPARTGRDAKAEGNMEMAYNGEKKG